MHKGFLKTGAIMALLAVILGAFGAHSLKSIYPENALTVFETGVRYQFYHAIALILTGILFKEYQNNCIKKAGVFFITGIILFSVSLFLLTIIKGNNIIGLSGLGILTPFGGAFFIAGWVSLFLGINKKPLD